MTIGAGLTALPGTLTVPNGKGPFPAVVLVHGSGPNDRDESIGANKPFCDLAYGLASNGVAVLRYDKRTRVHPEQFAHSVFTVKEETIDDALAAVALLRANAHIDPSRIFVLGHSLGGMLIPRIGLADKHIAGLIIMAGATMPLGETMLRQVRYIASAQGPITAQVQQKIDALAGQVARVNALQSADATSREYIIGVPPAYWLDLRDYHPAEAAKKLTCPLLILQGERDYQVTAADNFKLWQDALHGQPHVTFHLYPRLNHLFIAGDEPSLPAEYNRAGHVDEQVIRDCRLGSDK